MPTCVDQADKRENTGCYWMDVEGGIQHRVVSYLRFRPQQCPLVCRASAHRFLPEGRAIPRQSLGADRQ